MLDRLRTKLESVLSSVGTVFSRTGVPATGWTAVGLALFFLAAWEYSAGGYSHQLLGGVLVLLSGFFDIVDGAVARVTGKTSPAGAFLDSTLDRVAEVALFSGILLGAYAGPLTVVLALSLSLLVSYTRAKGEALGVKLAGVGIGERSERLLIVSLSSILGVLGWGVVLVILVAGFTFAERSYIAVRTLNSKPQGA